MKKHICFVINQLGGVGSGGSDRVLCVIANELAARGWQVEICALTDDQTVGRGISPDIKLHFLPKIASDSKYVRILGRITGGIRMLARYRRQHPGVPLISFISWVSICSTIASLRSSGGLILSERTDPAIEPGNQIARKVRDLCYRRADRIVFQTPDARDYFTEVIRQRGVVIGNPVTSGLPTWAPEPGTKTFVAASRLEAQKNVFLLIRAFAQFHAAHPEVRLTILGEGKQRPELEKLVSELGVDSCIEMPGHVSNIHEHLQRSYAFVTSSDYEGMPNSLLEAMSMGLPAIATDCPVGGPRVLIDDNINGKLVPVGSVEDLATALSEFADAPQDATRMGNAAVAVREDYSKEHIVSKWEQVIEELLAGDRVRV